MHNSFRNNIPLMLFKDDGLLILNIEQQFAVQSKEKFIFINMFVPMVFTFDDTQPYNRFIYFT